MTIAGPSASPFATPRVFRQATTALLTKVVAAAVTYAFLVYLARSMPPADFGLVAFFLNLSLLASVAGAAGQQMVLLRDMPALLQNQRLAEAGALRRTSFRIAILGAIVAAVLALIVIGAAAASGTADFPGPVAVLGVALIPLVGWIDIQSHVARAQGRYQLALVPKDILWRGLSFALLAAFGWMSIAEGLTPEVALLTLIAVLVFLNLWVRNRLGEMPSAAAGPLSLPRGSGHYWVTSVSNIFLANMDVILIGLLAGPAPAGLYFAANRLAQLLAFFTVSFNIVLAPALSASRANGDTRSLTALVHIATVQASAPTLGAGALMLIFAPQVLGLFGPDFVQATTALRLLALAGILNAVLGPADVALNMCGHEAAAMRAAAFTLALSFVALLAGALLLGANGVAAAVLAGTVLRKCVYWAMARNLLNIRTDLWAAVIATRAAP